jgi:MATE family multidrug resistance protein
LNKKILDLAIPNVISNITVPLLSMVDLAVLGHLESEAYIGAIAIGGIIFNFIYWGFGFLRMGTSGMTAQAYGAGNKVEMALIFARAAGVALASALLIWILQVPIAKVSFLLLEASDEVESLASSYFYIRIYAAPATIGLYALTGWFLGMQNARYPMVLAIVVNMLNIGFNLLFVMVLGMKSDGVALGTVLAQYSGLILGILLFFKKYRSFSTYWNVKGIIQWKELRNFFIVNRDIMIRTLLLLFVFAYFTSESAKINDTVLAVNTLLLQFLFIFSYLIDGYANAAEALTGRYVGARQRDNLVKALKLLFYWGLGISVPFTFAYVFGGRQILRILTNNPDLIQLSGSYLPWVAAIPLVSFAAFIWDGVFAGATATKAMRNTMFVATVVIFFPVSYFGIKYYGNHGIWLAMVVFMLARSVILSLLYRRSVLQKVIS